MIDAVNFRSCPKMFEKEKSGAKCNTLRRVDEDDIRFETLRFWQRGQTPEWKKKINIINSETEEVFTRTISDYTEWEGWAIISWRVE